MREILFKGLTYKKDEWLWVEGNYWQNIRKGKSHHIIDRDSNEWSGILPETRSQFTGQTDIAGLMIFENDKVLWKGQVRVVKWDDESCAFLTRELEPPHGTMYGLSWMQHAGPIQVVGNIHDRPSHGITVSPNWDCKITLSEMLSDSFAFTNINAGRERLYIKVNNKVEFDRYDCFEIGNDRYGIIVTGCSKFGPSWGEGIVDSSKEVEKFVKEYLVKMGMDYYIKN